MKKVLIMMELVAVFGFTVKAAMDWKVNPKDESSFGNTVQMLVDAVSTTVTYIGRAKSGSATSESVWQIYKVTVSGTLTTIQFYNGDAGYSFIWDDRATATYK